MSNDFLTISEIQRITAQLFDIPLKVFLSKRRHHRISHPRQIAMWAAVKLLPYRSLPEIGRAFDRDHTTVMHAEIEVDKRRMVDPEFMEMVNAVLGEIERSGLVIAANPARPRRVREDFREVRA